ncbi:hypothetical protein GCM10023107_23270 [Actinoplanes octamycinicus]|nr:hypothetical protein Aoc01nite_74230 [Actinoplanes octamycinicus]
MVSSRGFLFAVGSPWLLNPCFVRATPATGAVDRSRGSTRCGPGAGSLGRSGLELWVTETVAGPGRGAAPGLSAGAQGCLGYPETPLSTSPEPRGAPWPGPHPASRFAGRRAAVQCEAARLPVSADRPTGRSAGAGGRVAGRSVRGGEGQGQGGGGDHAAEQGEADAADVEPGAQPAVG